jgi:hypothetical protein
MNTKDYTSGTVEWRGKAQPGQVAAHYATWPVGTTRSRIGTAISSPDFVAIALFSAIGLLATLNLLLHMPNIGGL